MVEFTPVATVSEDRCCDKSGCDRPAVRQSEAIAAESDRKGALCGRCYQAFILYARWGSK